MSSRKMFVCLFMVLTILWGFSSGYVLAQAQNKPKSSDTSSDETKSSVIVTATVPEVHPMPIVVPTVPDIQYGSKEEMRRAQDVQRRVQDEMRKAAQEMRKAAQKMKIEVRRPGGGFGYGQAFLPSTPGTGWSWDWQHSDDPEVQALREKEQKIEEEAQEIVEKYNETQDKEEQTKLKKQLQDKTVEQFDVRQQYRELEVKRLEKELARIRETIQKRNEKRDEIIKRRIGQLIREEEDDLEF